MSANPIATRARPNCPHCGQAGRALHQQLRDVHHGVAGKWSINACDQCESQWLDPVPEPHEIARLYPESYAATRGAPADLLHGPRSGMGALRAALKREVLRRGFGYDALPGSLPLALPAALIARIGPIRRLVGLNNVLLLSAPPGRVLDVGCGNGRFLFALQQLGWTVEGIEPDPAAAAQARVAGIHVIESPIEGAVIPDGSYDAITIHHVLEHLVDPGRMLEAAARWLRPGGTLVVAVPNPLGAVARHFGAAWRGFDVPRHLVLLSPKALQRAMTAAGLQADLHTPTRFVPWMLNESSDIARRQSGTATTYIERVRCALQSLRHERGEEIVCVGRKP